MTRSLLAPLSHGQITQLLASDVPHVRPEPSVVLLRWCAVCQAWMREGSAEAGRCVDCGTARG